MKITRKHLRNIIKEELSRLFENPEIPWDEGGTGDIQIKGDVNREFPEIPPDLLAFLSDVQDASNDLEIGYNDPLDSLADQILSGEVTSLAQAREMAELALDMLARLDNAEQIGVYQASVSLGL